MKNAAVAALFETMADVMEIKGENAFRVNSYRKVARILRDLTEDLEAIHTRGELTELPGVGQSSAEKIAQYFETGRVAAYDELLDGFPLGALDMLRVPGLGPKTVGRLMAEKGIDSLDALEQAARTGGLTGLPGMGEKTVANILSGIDFLKRSAGRILLGRALPVAERIIGALREGCDLKAITAAGSLRRMQETVGDIDILATVEAAPGDEAAAGRRIVDAFAALPGVAEVLAAGDTKGSVRTEDGLQVDLRVVRPESYGAALHYFTGSKAHNVRLRGRAIEMGLKVNEYGVFEGDRRVAGATEEEVYEALGLRWIPPELREERGEIEAAEAGTLPRLVTLDDIRGDLHAHTDYSDGVLPVFEMAAAAQELGYAYLAITDHSPSLGIARGLSAKRLREQQKEIRAARRRLPGFRILSGTEADILPDGTLDYPESVLAGLDFVIASVHTHFRMAEDEMTERILAAVRSPYVAAIGHLTGRLLGQREGYAVDVGRVLEACAESGTALELNAHTERLDINDTICRRAKDADVRVMIGTDAHRPEHFGLMALGIGTARRGWLEPGDVLNCMGADELTEYVRAKRPARRSRKPAT
ncbi:MAG: DNA polymerase/3'-5' exonuclease PolX [Candidatus Brocadiaceae bacterium]|nr:DNA polymerase/3'-5' exonuclease PolX [Candidatus Brocadiaceae bacterium]